MNTVLNLVEFRERRETPVFVLADLHKGVVADEDTQTDDFRNAVDNCKAALDHARAIGLPIAFLRQSAPARSLLESRPYPSWLAGFEPRRTDMIFDRNMPSGYASPEFSRMIEQNSRCFVLAGLASEMSCVSTMTHAFHHFHQVTYLADASFCGSKRYFSSNDMRSGINGLLSLYGAISNTRSWMSVSSRSAMAGA